MLWIKSDLRPVNLQTWILSLLAVITLGGALIQRGFRAALEIEPRQDLTSTHELAQV